MAQGIIVTRGYTFVAGIPYNVDDLNAAALPNISLVGSVGAEEIGPGTINTTHLVPGPYFTADSTGSGGNYLVNLTPGLSAYDSGAWLSFKANHPNPGAATLNVNGLGPKAILFPSAQALIGSEIVTGQEVWVQYNGTAWILVSEPSVANPLYVNDTGAANAYVIALPGLTFTSLTSLVGRLIWFKAAAANTGASTLAVNGLAATAITKKGTTALTANDILTGGIVGVIFDGTRFQLCGTPDAPALPSIGSAGSVIYPYSLIIDGQGRVTSKAGGLYSGVLPIPDRGHFVTFTHTLGRIPAFVSALLVMGPTVELGFSENDRVPVTALSMQLDTDSDDFAGPAFQVTWNDTTVVVARANGEPEWMTTKTGNSTYEKWTPTLWTLLVIAW